VALVHSWHSGLLVTLGGCRHLDGLELWWIVKHHLEIVWWLQSRLIVRCFELTPQEITKGYSSGLLEASWSGPDRLTSCHTHVEGQA
jgi:hypothetical protein